MKDNDIKQDYPGILSMCEIFMCESPVNVMAESLGRLKNKIRDKKLKNRMSNSTVESHPVIYKNTGHILQFWEEHLEILAIIMIDFLNMYFSLPDSGVGLDSHKSIIRYAKRNIQRESIHCKSFLK